MPVLSENGVARAHRVRFKENRFACKTILTVGIISPAVPWLSTIHTVSANHRSEVWNFHLYQYTS
jgi:hypothetical protein